MAFLKILNFTALDVSMQKCYYLVFSMKYIVCTKSLNVFFVILLMLTFRSKLSLGLNCSDKKVFENLKYVEGFFIAEAKTESYEKEGQLNNFVVFKQLCLELYQTSRPVRKSDKFSKSGLSGNPKFYFRTPDI